MEVVAVDIHVVQVPWTVGADSSSGKWRLEARIPDRQADGVIGELVDVGRAQPVAGVGRIRAEVGVRIALVAGVESKRALAVLERSRGLQVDRAGETLANQLRIGRLVDDGTGEELRWVLVELDVAVVAGAHLFAAVQECVRKCWVGTAHADRGCVPGGTLRRYAGEPRKRVRNTDVRKLADVLGGNRLDDAARVMFYLDRLLDGHANAGDDDFLQLAARTRRGGRLLRMTGRCDCKHQD